MAEFGRNFVPRMIQIFQVRRTDHIFVFARKKTLLATPTKACSVSKEKPNFFGVDFVVGGLVGLKISWFRNVFLERTSKSDNKGSEDSKMVRCLVHDKR